MRLFTLDFVYAAELVSSGGFTGGLRPTCRVGEIGRQEGAVNHCPTPLSAWFGHPPPPLPLPSPDVREVTEWSITDRQKMLRAISLI